jgi:tRNA G46 methylase TrmB
LQAQLEAQLESVRHQNRMQIEMLKAQAMLGFKTDDKEFKEKIEVFKENRKDERVTKQAIEQSKLIEQRKQSNII